MDPHDLVTIFSAKNTVQANILRNLLMDEGIEATIINDVLSTGSAELVGWNTEPKVQVQGKDEPQARSIAVQWEKQIMQRGELTELEVKMLASDELSGDGGECIVCHVPRSAVCSECHLVSNDFGVAEFEPVEGYHDFPEDAELPDDQHESAHEIRLMCTVCDKGFVPQYVRNCTGCGYDFGDGVEVEHGPASEGLSRAVAVIAVLVGAGLIALCYFVAARS